MNDLPDVLTLVAATNPIPDLDSIDPVELEQAIAGLEAAWQPELGTIGIDRAHRRRFRPAVVAIAIAFVITLAIGIPFALLQSTDDPVVTQAPTTLQSPTTAVVTTVPVTTAAPPPTTETTAPLQPMPALTIEAASTTASTEDVFLSRIIPGASGGPAWIAVGTRQTVVVSEGDFAVPLDGSVWVSDNGLAWRPVGDPGQFDDSYIEDVVAGADGYVAVGWGENHDAAVWHSRDGIEWARFVDESFGGPNAQSMAAVAYGPAGFVAGGEAGSTAAMWFSEDGVSWRQVGDDVFDTGTVPSNIWGGASVAYGAGTYMAHGTVGFSDTYSATERHVLWTSVDGVTWAELPVEVFGIDPDDEYAFGMVLGGGPQLIVEVEAGDSAGIWRSRDGRTWEPWPVVFETGVMNDSDPQRPDHVATLWDGARWVFFGVDWTTGGVWITHDLSVPWQQVGSLPEMSPNGDLTIAATPDAMVLATELEVRSGSPYMAFWLGTWDR